MTWLWKLANQLHCQYNCVCRLVMRSPSTSSCGRRYKQQEVCPTDWTGRPSTLQLVPAQTSGRPLVFYKSRCHKNALLIINKDSPLLNGLYRRLRILGGSLSEFFLQESCHNIFWTCKIIHTLWHIDKNDKIQNTPFSWIYKSVSSSRSSTFAKFIWSRRTEFSFFSGPTMLNQNFPFMNLIIVDKPKQQLQAGGPSQIRTLRSNGREDSGSLWLCTHGCGSHVRCCCQWWNHSKLLRYGKIFALTLPLSIKNNISELQP